MPSCYRPAPNAWACSVGSVTNVPKSPAPRAVRCKTRSPEGALLLSHPSVGELESVRDTPITVGGKALPVQLFLWTLLGGQHFIEFSEIDVKLKVRDAPCQ